MNIRIEVDGQLVYQGVCDDGCSIERWADESPKYKRSVEVHEAVILDFTAGDVLIGVELLSHPEGFSLLDAVARARQRGITDEVLGTS